MSFDGRIGLAFHRVLEALPAEVAGLTPAAAADTARRRFADELSTQHAAADARPRERGLPRSQARVDAALEALLVASRQYAHTGVRHGAGPVPGRLIELEVPVRTADGLLAGRVDRAEHRPEGLLIVDYKSALRPDLPERYERQVQLYALMWRETRGTWPVGAEVVYPLTGAVHRVAIIPATCERVGEESRALVWRLGASKPADELATPGDVCTVCEFRPWCRPFWRWQAEEPQTAHGLTRAALGWEGTITRLSTTGDTWRAEIAWQTARIELVVPRERFPHLALAFVGTRVRGLDMPLHGLRHRPRARVDERSELFLMGG